MSGRSLAGSTFFCVIVFLAIGPARAAEYRVDPSHSSLIFKVNHMGAGNVFGAIPDLSGTLTYDAGNVANCAVSITAKPESLTTFNQRRDTHLKSADFFSAKEFPTVTFKSVSWKKVDDTTYEVRGDFTLLGITKAITVHAQITGSGKDRQGTDLIGFESTFTIDRTDYSMNYGVAKKGGLGKDVTITVAIECQKQ